ncbi:MAG: hypothetical protein ACREHD_32125 [Pirellulales bacterium]
MRIVGVDLRIFGETRGISLAELHFFAKTRRFCLVRGGGTPAPLGWSAVLCIVGVDLRIFGETRGISLAELPIFGVQEAVRW